MAISKKEETVQMLRHQMQVCAFTIYCFCIVLFVSVTSALLSFLFDGHFKDSIQSFFLIFAKI